MSLRVRKGETGAATGAVREVPRREWDRFLAKFSRDHASWLVSMETHDQVTGEDVVSRETPLESVEYDLEDQKNPRINVNVRMDNKSLRHILFRPSRLIVRSSEDGRRETMRITTLNTKTSVHFRSPAREVHRQQS